MPLSVLPFWKEIFWMLHEPASNNQHDPAMAYKTRLGVYMFFLYLIIYGGFVAINVLKPALMEKKILLGLNLAVVYGFGLIIFALLSALFYNRLCNRREKAMAEDAPRKEAV